MRKLSLILFLFSCSTSKKPAVTPERTLQQAQADFRIAIDSNTFKTCDKDVVYSTEYYDNTMVGFDDLPEPHTKYQDPLATFMALPPDTVNLKIITFALDDTLLLTPIDTIFLNNN
jgi:hypothetical protein